MSAFITMLASYAVSITAILAAVTAVCKPLRTWFKDKFTSEKKIMEKLDALDRKIEAVKAANDSNERDRLKGVLFAMAERARRCEEIAPDEFQNFCEDVKKYRDLKGNHLAGKMADYVVDYYNRKGWANHG